MSSVSHFDDAFPFDSYDQWMAFDPSQQHTNELQRDGTPSAAIITVSDTTPVSEDACSQRQMQPIPEKLGLLQRVDWDEEKAYNEDPPSCIHYSIEWKITVNNKVISRDTEQDLVLAPSCHWLMFLRPKLEKLLCKKLPQNRPVKIDDTDVVVSVTDRIKRDLRKRFDDADIDLAIVERQLVVWGELFRAGKKLRIDLSFNYVEASQSSTITSRKGDKRGASSVTQKMLTERATQLDAEEGDTGSPSIW
jgi:hypothetical protein